jgi:hypothetical protein
LYEYEERAAIIVGTSKRDQVTQRPLNSQQKIFRTTNNTYFYRCQERLIATAAKPLVLSKNYRLGTRSLNPLPLLKLAKKSTQKSALLLNQKSSDKKLLEQDFQQLLITRLLQLCKKAEFLKIPLEQDQIPKEGGVCNQSLVSHFQTKSILNFTFAPQQALAAQQFFDQLDTYAEEYDLEASDNFQDPSWTDPVLARKSYLDN